MKGSFPSYTNHTRGGEHQTTAFPPANHSAVPPLFQPPSLGQGHHSQSLVPSQWGSSSPVRAHRPHPYTQQTTPSPALTVPSPGTPRPTVTTVSLRTVSGPAVSVAARSGTWCAQLEPPDPPVHQAMLHRPPAVGLSLFLPSGSAPCDCILTLPRRSCP